MLNELQPDLPELVRLIRAVANFDTTMSAAIPVCTPHPAEPAGLADHERTGKPNEQLRGK